MLHCKKHQLLKSLSKRMTRVTSMGFIVLYVNGFWGLGSGNFTILHPHSSSVDIHTQESCLSDVL